MRVGLALGGGGARGLAHVLALEALDEAGVRPAILSGTSMGAIMATLYAAGWTGRQIRDWLAEVNLASTNHLKDIYRRRTSLARWFGSVRPAWKATGMLDAGRFLGLMLQELAVKDFADLKRPLRIVATDFHRAAPVIFSSGPILPALQASMSIPGVFVPVEHEGRVLVDGGMVNNLPYDLLREACDATIAIDVGPARDAHAATPPNLLDATLGMFDIFLDRVTEAMLAAAPPTIYVRPRLTGIRTLDFSRTDDIYAQAAPAMALFADQLRRGLPATPVAIRA